MTYDSDATRARLLEAAHDEFLERGLAGARVDRIATAASANKQAIYAYYGSKNALFDAVLEARLGVLADLVPFTPDDLPGYVGALFDYLVAEPGVMRLMQWKALERPEASAQEVRAHVDKAAELSAAHDLDQEQGVDALMLTLALAQAWNLTPPEIRSPAGRESAARLKRHRAAVIRATAAVVGELLGGATH
ncbi:TetR family transcriptional regulator [Amycolatopsis rhabdoformis]|uniref:TetR family transcriptional regulator n=1 Tax=Amycolatopsis rhabdoformis TaxID=1448059 RepID=A0ABZ1IGB7_9PSEU|nr:TetR family transcriptional regulator [Amycolatopsis rhabdoformis]WSE32718.1 TetR family transcriptional regulator [Amycolatopsis rhabdoformis]